MKIAQLLIIFILTSSVPLKYISEAKAQVSSTKSYIGLRYQDEPYGLKVMAGWAIGDSKYGVSEIASALIAIAEFEPEKEYLTQILKSWRASRLTEKFEEINTNNIRCENPSWGL